MAITPECQEAVDLQITLNELLPSVEILAVVTVLHIVPGCGPTQRVLELRVSYIVRLYMPTRSKALL